METDGIFHYARNYMATSRLNLYVFPNKIAVFITELNLTLPVKLRPV